MLNILLSNQIFIFLNNFLSNLVQFVYIPFECFQRSGFKFSFVQKIPDVLISQFFILIPNFWILMVMLHDQGLESTLLI